MKKLLIALGTGLVIIGVVYGVLRWSLQRRVEGAYFDSAGVKLHYTEAGRGTPVILLHGFAGHADLNWRRSGIIEALSQRYRVIALDHRGHGLSEKPYSPEAYGQHMVDDVIRLMDHLEIKKAHVAGYSMGGMITLQVLLRYPERLLSAVPCATGWFKPEDPKHQIFKALAESLEAGKGIGPLMATLAPGKRKPGPAKRLLADHLVNCLNDQYALAQVVRGFEEFSVTEEALRKNTVPTLTIVGGDDPTRMRADALLGVMPHYEVMVIDRASHMSAPAYPEFLAALMHFLQQH